MVPKFEDLVLPRDDLLWPGDAHDDEGEDERLTDLADGRVAGAEIDNPLLARLLDVNVDCVGEGAMVIPFDTVREVTGWVRLLPNFLVSPLLITKPWFPEYP